MAYCLIISPGTTLPFIFLVLCFSSSHVHPSSPLVSFCIPQSASHTYLSLLRPRRILLFLPFFFLTFTSSFSYMSNCSRLRLRYSPRTLYHHPLSLPPSLFVAVSGSVLEPHFVKITPSHFAVFFLLNSGCAPVKAASGRAHVPYHGRRSVSRCIANPGSARIAPICNE
jgi:hypothetical protein